MVLRLIVAAAALMASGCTLLLDSEAPRFADASLGEPDAAAPEGGTPDDAAAPDAGDDAAARECTAHAECQATAPECYEGACDMSTGMCRLSVAPDCTACGEGPSFTCVRGSCRERGIIYATGFEAGEFEITEPWWTSPRQPWVRTSDDRHEGQSSVRSGRLDNDGEGGSELRLSLTDVPEGAWLRLWFTMSSETSDYFRIEIEDAFVERAQWSGEQEWQPFEAEVLATGEVDFTFLYKKDVGGTAGEDLVRIDDLEVYVKCDQGTNATSSMQ